MAVNEIKKIRKRDGQIVPFTQDKVTNAIFKAAVAVGGEDKNIARGLSEKVMEILRHDLKPHEVPTVEGIQDVVEKVLIDEGHAQTAKAFIIYRQKHRDLREMKKVLVEVEDDVGLSINALKVLEKRYLRKNDQGEIIETPRALFHRVADNIAEADKLYDKNADLKKTADEFFEFMISLDFMPNSPTLMNAGTKLQQLAACYVLPIEDNMECIFESVKNTALIHQSGGGTGFSFSQIRPKGDLVKSTGGIASGPISFMTVFDAATETIKQGGKRRGANMGILNIDHPDILNFIVAKEKEHMLNNFNLSVGITEKFMKAVKANADYELLNPRDGEVRSKLNAKEVFDLIASLAWKNGEPGIIFLDRLNKDNPTPHIGKIESTNPCGEQPLLPYESCNLGSINLGNVIVEGKVDFEHLKKAVWISVHFLDNVIDMCKYPLDKIDQMVKANRKIGLGVMGWADMLTKLSIPYNSEKALKKAEELMKFISDEAKNASLELAKKRGVFSNFKGSTYDTGKSEDRVRNSTRITIAPTGTISIIANCSSGIEPLFAISYIRNVMDNVEMLEVNPEFKRVAKDQLFYSDALMKKIASTGSVQNIEQVPDDVKKVFATAHSITPEWHIRMQGAFQKYTDNAVSKTVNFPHDATIEDVRKVYELAYELGCKGVTVYRDMSRKGQVLRVAKEDGKTEETEELKVDLEYSGGCPECER